MNRAVRAIIVRDDQLLVMRRNKFGQEYYTLIGGHVSLGESEEHALVREVYEETSLKVTKARLVAIEEAGVPYGTQYIYECQDPGGEVKMLETADEWHISKGGQNVYEPMWIDIDQLPDVPFRSERLKDFLLMGFKKGFPASTTHLNQ